jgi:hypothetical protein
MAGGLRTRGEQMVDEATAGKEEKGGSNLAAILGWGGLAVAALGFGFWVFSSQLSIRWEGREKEALEMARNFQAEGMKYKLDDLKIELQSEARARGEFIGQFEWSTVHSEGPVYKVTLTWMEKDQHRRAAWNVDLAKKTVTPADPEAEAFIKRTTQGAAAAAP